MKRAKLAFDQTQVKRGKIRMKEMTRFTYKQRAAAALYGLFIGDALAMPVHWYYNTSALEKDYGQVKTYMAPKNPHPDSILWRSSYSPVSKKADILHHQAKYWGRRGIHYHQFLKAGENTLNLKLARELLVQQKQIPYDPRAWLAHMVTFMTTPGSHNDTYVEEYLRHFFTRCGKGVDLLECGRTDENHIGGLSLMLPLVIVLGQDREHALNTALDHLGFTHGGSAMQSGGKMVANILLDLLHGQSIEAAVAAHYHPSHGPEPAHSFDSLVEFPDQIVVGKHFSSACYMDQSVPATLFLALKYARDPEAGLVDFPGTRVLT